MTQTATIFLSILIVAVLSAGVTAFVAARTRRAPSVATREATEVGVSFVVCARRWQSALIRWTGFLFVVVGCVLLLVAVFAGADEEARGAGIPGVVIALGGLLFVWMAHGMTRARLEVTRDDVWVFRWAGAPRQVSVREIERLTPLTGNNYGGVVARSEAGRLFSANRLMLGYPQLIEHLRARRPDLAIPEASWPLQ